MNDPMHAKRHQTDGPKSLFSHYLRVGGLAPIVVLLLVLGAEVGAYCYGKIASQLGREGIETDATVIDVQQYEDSTSDPKTGYSTETLWTIIDYEFKTESRETIRDQMKSKSLNQIPEIGSSFVVRYAESDPSIHEARVGHYQSNAEAMHWIAAFFVGVTLVCMVVFFFKALRNWRAAISPDYS